MSNSNNTVPSIGTSDQRERNITTGLFSLSNEIIQIIFYIPVLRYVILCPTLIVKSRDASIILFPTLIDRSPDSSNELLRIIFYTKVCNIISNADQ